MHNQNSKTRKSNKNIYIEKEYSMCIVNIFTFNRIQFFNYIQCENINNVQVFNFLILSFYQQGDLKWEKYFQA